jgi:hypothetical protein
MSSVPQGHSAISRPRSRDSHATVGQFSFAPATRTTVVTTTYTTTTTLAPMRINARSLCERDPKEYPLAHVRAPESIRKIYFDAGGEIGCFEEADDAAKKAQEVRCWLHQGSALYLSRSTRTRRPRRLTLFSYSMQPSKKACEYQTARCARPTLSKDPRHSLPQVIRRA